MAKYKKEFENGIVKHTLNFRGKEFDFSMIPTFFGASADKKCFSAQLAETFPDINEDELDMIDCLSDDDEVLEVLSVLEQLE